MLRIFGVEARFWMSREQTKERSEAEAASFWSFISRHVQIEIKHLNIFYFPQNFLSKNVHSCPCLGSKKIPAGDRFSFGESEEHFSVDKAYLVLLKIAPKFHATSMVSCFIYHAKSAKSAFRHSGKKCNQEFLRISFFLSPPSPAKHSVPSTRCYHFPNGCFWLYWNTFVANYCKGASTIKHLKKSFPLI